AYVEGGVNVFPALWSSGFRAADGRCRRAAMFRRGEVSCRVHSIGEGYGTARCRLLVLQARGPRRHGLVDCWRHSGARILLRVEGVQAAERLDEVDSIWTSEINPA